MNDDSVTEGLTVISEDSGVSLTAEGALGTSSQAWPAWAKTLSLELLGVGSQGVPGPVMFRYWRSFGKLHCFQKSYSY